MTIRIAKNEDGSFSLTGTDLEIKSVLSGMACHQFERAAQEDLRASEDSEAAASARWYRSKGVEFMTLRQEAALL